MAHIAVWNPRAYILAMLRKSLCCALAGALAALPAGAYIALLPTWQTTGEIVAGWALIAMTAVGLEWLRDELRGV